MSTLKEKYQRFRQWQEQPFNWLSGQKVETAGVVVDHSKASGLELRQPHGAQAVGLVWRGESGRP